MDLTRYFDLGLFPEEAALGAKTERNKKRREGRRLIMTLAMYASVWLGVIGQKALTLYQAGQPATWQNLGQGFTIIALVIATAIFPAVFPKTFAKMPPQAQKSGAWGWLFVQMCVSFQQGFFWQALLSLMIPKP